MDKLIETWFKLDRKRKSLNNFDEVDQLHEFKEEVSNFHDVRQFHEKFGLIVGPSPQHLTDRKLQERMEFMVEEVQEFCQACGWKLSIDLAAEEFHQNLAAQADALVDLVYVAMGTAVMLGLPWTQLWDDVQRANMAKVRGETHRGHPVDVAKPSGWEGPKTGEILAHFGYNEELHNKEELYVDDEL